MDDPALIAAAFAAAFLASLSGIGNALVLAPFAAAALPLPAALATVNASGVVSAAVAVLGETRARPRLLARPLLALAAFSALLVIPVGLLAARLDARIAGIAFGLTLIAGAAAGWRVARRSGHARPAAASPLWAGPVAAWSMLGSALAGVAGPPVAVWSAAARWDPARARTTMQVYFAVANALTLAVGTLDGRLGTIDVPVLLASAAGAAAGLPLRTRITGTALRGLLLGIAAAGGALAIWRALHA